MSMLQIHLFKIIDNLSFDFCCSLIYKAFFSRVWTWLPVPVVEACLDLRPFSVSISTSGVYKNNFKFYSLKCCNFGLSVS